jgi:hypothetical protein
MNTFSRGMRTLFLERLDALEEEMRHLKKQHDKLSPSKQTNSLDGSQSSSFKPDDGDNA